MTTLTEVAGQPGVLRGTGPGDPDLVRNLFALARAQAGAMPGTGQLEAGRAGLRGREYSRTSPGHARVLLPPLIQTLGTARTGAGPGPGDSGRAGRADGGAQAPPGGGAIPVICPGSRGGKATERQGAAAPVTHRGGRVQGQAGRGRGQGWRLVSLTGQPPCCGSPRPRSAAPGGWKIIQCPLPATSRGLMATGVIFSFPGGTTGHHDQVCPGLNTGQLIRPLADRPAGGGLPHAAGPAAWTCWTSGSRPGRPRHPAPR